MKNLQLISTSYRIRDLAEVGFAFGRRIKGFSIDIKETDVGDIQKLLACRSSKTAEIYTHVSQKSLANSKSPLDHLIEQQSNDNVHVTEHKSTKIDKENKRNMRI